LSELGRLREENATLQGRVAEMAVTMARLRRDVLEASEPDLVQLAISIAERVVGRELASDPQLIVSWAREAIQALASKNEVVIALAKDLLSQVPTEAWEGVGFAHAIQADLELAAGTIEVRAPGAVVGAGAQARLDSVAQALGVGERQGQS
jgi:flagellar assembly protein FliH